jgi:hypothetical protein
MIFCENIRRSVDVSMHSCAGRRTDVAPAMYSALLVAAAAAAACQAGVFLADIDHPDPQDTGLVPKHLEDQPERPAVEPLVLIRAPVLAIPYALWVPHDDRGDAASARIADNGLGKAVVDKVFNVSIPFCYYDAR